MSYARCGALRGAVSGALPRGARRGAVLGLGLLLAAALPVAAAPQEEPAAAKPLEVPTHTITESGDSWLGIRGRLCPMELFQAANPALANRQLRPGDRIESPLVSAVELQRAKSAYTELERRLASELERGASLESRVSGFEKVQSELAVSREAEAAAQRNATLLMLAACGGFALAAAGGVLAFALRKDAERAHKRVTEAEERYADLRRSLQGLEVQLQKRALDLLGVHKASGLSPQQMAEAALPVIEMAERLKRRHAG